MKIGIMGLAGAGKDEFAKQLVKFLPEYSIDRFAAPLKEAAKYVFGENFDDRAVKEQEVQVTFKMADRMIEGAMLCCNLLGFSEAEENEASIRYFEHIGHLDNVSPRLYQQLLGTEVIRKVRESAFVDRIQKKENVVVPDCRFGDEKADVTFLVVRRAALPDVRPAHSSEHLAFDLTQAYYDGASFGDGAPIVIENDGSLELLEYNAEVYSQVLLDYYTYQ